MFFQNFGGETNGIGRAFSVSPVRPLWLNSFLLLSWIASVACFHQEPPNYCRSSSNPLPPVTSGSKESLPTTPPPEAKRLQTSNQRRQFFQSIATGTATGIFAPPLLVPQQENGMNSLQTVAAATAAETDAMSYSVYQVIPDPGKNLNPSLKSLDFKSFRKQLSSRPIGGALWLGEHHNSMRDHNIQVQFIKDLRAGRQNKNKNNNKGSSKLAVGLEQVQMQFQPVLDDFVNGKCTVEELKEGVEWGKRWVWPFEVYQELFVTCQTLGIPLIALNVNSEDLSLVEEGGLPALSQQSLFRYISDPVGFAEFASHSDFSTYVDYVIRPSYNFHLELGLLNSKMSGEPLKEPMSFRNFLSGRILWDEAMANRAYTWTRDNPGGLLLGLVGADHVKFGKGIPGRFARLIGSNNKGNTNDKTNTVHNHSSISVLLNPTLVDSRPPGSVRGIPTEAYASGNPDSITLQLRYLKDGFDPALDDRFSPSSTGGVLPLADFLLLG